MSLASAARLRNYCVREKAGQLRADGILSLRLKRPFQANISLRERGSDLATFQQIAVEEVYGPVLRTLGSFQTVIDLGANIGLASLYLANNSPTCRVLCVEPNSEAYEMTECAQTHSFRSLPDVESCSLGHSPATRTQSKGPGWQI